MASHAKRDAAHGMEDAGETRSYDPKVLLRLLSFVRPYWFRVMLSVLVMLIYTGTAVAIPWIVQLAMDSVVVSGDIARLRSVILAFVLVIAVNFIAGYVHLRLLARVGQWVVLDLRMRLFAHLQRLSISFYDRHEVGRIMSRGQNDVQQLQEFLTIMVLSLGDLLTLIGIVTAMLLMQWKLATISLAVLPVLLVVLWRWQPIAWRVFMRVRRAIAIVNANLQENISGVRVIQSLNRQQGNMSRFDELNSDHRNAGTQAVRLAAVLMPVSIS